MHRTQLSLEDWQYQALKSLSERSGRSISDVVREILANHLDRSRKSNPKKLRSISGFLSDPDAAGRDHDRVLYPDDQRLS